MKIDFSQTLTDFDGEPITDKDGKTPALLGKIIAASLGDTYPDEQRDAAETIRRYDLAIMICKGGEHEITPEDATLMRNLLAKKFAPVIAGQASKLLG